MHEAFFHKNKHEIHKYKHEIHKNKNKIHKNRTLGKTPGQTPEYKYISENKNLDFKILTLLVVNYYREKIYKKAKFSLKLKNLIPQLQKNHKFFFSLLSIFYSLTLKFSYMVHKFKDKHNHK